MGAGLAPAGPLETYFLFECALREGAASPGLQKEIQMALQPVEISRDSRVKNHRAVHMEHAKFEPFGERSSWTRRSSRRRLRQDG